MIHAVKSVKSMARKVLEQNSSSPNVNFCRQRVSLPGVHYLGKPTLAQHSCIEGITEFSVIPFSCSGGAAISTVWAQAPTSRKTDLPCYCFWLVSINLPVYSKTCPKTAVCILNFFTKPSETFAAILFYTIICFNNYVKALLSSRNYPGPPTSSFRR